MQIAGGEAPPEPDWKARAQVFTTKLVYRSALPSFVVSLLSGWLAGWLVLRRAQQVGAIKRCNSKTDAREPSRGIIRLPPPPPPSHSILTPVAWIRLPVTRALGAAGKQGASPWTRRGSHTGRAWRQKPARDEPVGFGRPEIDGNLLLGAHKLRSFSRPNARKPSCSTRRLSGTLRLLCPRRLSLAN